MGTNREEDNEQQSLFRGNAVKYYLDGREKDVLPKFISPLSFVLLWILFGLLIMGLAGGLYFSQVPAYASGTAVITDGENSRREGHSAIVFLPPEQLEDLQEGRELIIRLGSTEQLTLSLNHIDPGIVDPETARSKFALDREQVEAVDWPAAVATSALGTGGNSREYSGYGDIHQADVEIGSRKFTSLVAENELESGK